MDDEKFLNTIFIILISVGCIFMLVNIAILIDFYNDDQCSINKDPEYWKEHNCVRYCKECEDID